MFGLNTGFDASGKKLFQALMLEAYDHRMSITAQGELSRASRRIPP